MSRFHPIPILVLCALLPLLATCGGPGPVPDPAGLAPGPLSRAQALTQAGSLDRPKDEKGRASWTALAPALERSLRYLRDKPDRGLAMDTPWLTLNWRQVRLSLELLRELLPELDRDPGLLAERFTWVRADPETLVTGYYEPLIPASLRPDPEYPYPLYALPPEHLRTQSRDEIDHGQGLAGQGLEIAWLKDPLQAFALHIEGSGRLLLRDGTMRHVLYSGSNGRKYVSVGKVLADRGHMELHQVTMKSIHEFLDANPHLMREILGANPRYIYFKLGDDGPYGALGELLTPMVSVAVNPDYVPYGALMALKTDLPRADDQTPGRFQSLVLAMDTGSMRHNHLDLFCGCGGQAEYLAGHLKHKGELFILVRRDLLQ